MQANDTMGQDVFFNNVCQIVRGFLAVLGQCVKSFRKIFHDPGRAWNHNKDEHGEFPVQKHQIPDQSNKRKAVSG